MSRTRTLVWSVLALTLLALLLAACGPQTETVGEAEPRRRRKRRPPNRLKRPLKKRLTTPRWSR